MRPDPDFVQFLKSQTSEICIASGLGVLFVMFDVSKIAKSKGTCCNSMLSQHKHMNYVQEGVTIIIMTTLAIIYITNI